MSSQVNFSLMADWLNITSVYPGLQNCIRDLQAIEF